MEHKFERQTRDYYGDDTWLTDIQVCTFCGGTSYRGRLTSHCPEKQLSEEALLAIADGIIDYCTDKGWYVKIACLREG